MPLENARARPYNGASSDGRSGLNELRERIFEEILPYVQTPGQYAGGEVNAVVKRHEDAALTVCLAFPDTYAVGMSHLGLRILYHVLNARGDVACERAFAPWMDMEARLRAASWPLCSLESFTPLDKFDLVGFSLQYELSHTNLLTMLDLGRIPIRGADRTEAHPLVCAGGTGALSPEPIAPFVDFFVVGEAEEAILEIAGRLIEAKKSRASRRERLLDLARNVPGVYVPELYEAGADGAVRPTGPGAPEQVARRIVQDLDAASAPTRPVVPTVEIVHDRVVVEIMRGCGHACRFCQATCAYWPLRRRLPGTIERLIRESLAATGHEEVALVSLSSGDYPDLAGLIGRLAPFLEEQGVSISLPSLRVTDESARLPALVKRVRRGGLTLAPEAASDRLRRIIGKPVADGDLFANVEAAYAAGWEGLKLYFMIGLPGERDEEAAGIASLAGRASAARRRVARGPGRVNASVSNFVPKPGTPFQWEAFADRDALRARQGIVRDGVRSRRVRLRFHDLDMSWLEAVLSRGDRRLASAIEHAWRLGARFDAWTEGFGLSRWETAFRECGIDPAAYTGERAIDAPLPWDHIEMGRTSDYLASERDTARALCAEGEAP